MQVLRVALACGFTLATAARVAAQTLPAGPVELARGTVAISGELSASFGSSDDVAFFDYTDYEHNALRIIRAAVAGRWQPTQRLALLTQIRSENGSDIVPYALYLRVRPFGRVPFDIQAGRIPPVFGAFARRAYGTEDNPLVGYPLAYQYLTSLRPDAIPVTADDLLLMRARGWRASYPVGAPEAAPGVPLVSAYRWDTGVEGSVSTTYVDAAFAVTTGTLANPRVRDDNDGRQLSTRVAWKPMVGLVLGGSAARGAFLARSITDRYRPVLGDRAYTQTAIGLDGEYSRDHWMLRGEAIHTAFRLPALGVPLIASPLTATSAYLEGRYRLTPRFYAAGRVDGLTFSRITGRRLFAGAPTPWDAPVRRVEIGGGVYLQRNLTALLVLQRNWRDGGRVRARTYAAMRLAYWF